MLLQVSSHQQRQKREQA